MHRRHRREWDDTFQHHQAGTPRTCHCAHQERLEDVCLCKVPLCVLFWVLLGYHAQRCVCGQTERRNRKPQEHGATTAVCCALRLGGFSAELGGYGGWYVCCVLQ